MTATLSQPSTWPNKLMLAIPCAELGYSRFWQKLHTLHGYGWHVWKGLWASQSGQFVAQNRRTLVKEALRKPGWDRLLFLDSDHDFPADMLWRHAHFTQPVVAGIYPQRRIDQPVPVVYRWNEGRNSMSRPPLDEMFEMTTHPDTYKVDVVPLGCTSIRRDVLERWPNDLPMFAVKMLENDEIAGEDTWFCRAVQDQGHDVYVDTGLSVDHYALVPINIRFFQQWALKNYGAQQAS